MWVASSNKLKNLKSNKKFPWGRRILSRDCSVCSYLRISNIPVYTIDFWTRRSPKSHKPFPWTKSLNIHVCVCISPFWFVSLENPDWYTDLLLKQVALALGWTCSFSKISWNNTVVHQRQDLLFSKFSAYLKIITLPLYPRGWLGPTCMTVCPSSLISSHL